MQNAAGGDRPRNRQIDAVSVGKDISTGGNFLTSKLRFLAAFNEYLGDDEVIEASLTYQKCGACTIEIGAIHLSVLELSAWGGHLPLVLADLTIMAHLSALRLREGVPSYFAMPSSFRLHTCTVRMCRQ